MAADRDLKAIASDIKHAIIKFLKNFENFSREEIYDHRKSKFLQIGRSSGFNNSSNLNTSSLSYESSFLDRINSNFIKNKYLLLGFGLALIVSLFAILT